MLDLASQRRRDGGPLGAAPPCHQTGSWLAASWESWSLAGSRHAPCPPVAVSAGHAWTRGSADQGGGKALVQSERPCHTGLEDPGFRGRGGGLPGCITAEEIENPVAQFQSFPSLHFACISHASCTQHSPQLFSAGPGIQESNGRPRTTYAHASCTYRSRKTKVPGEPHMRLSRCQDPTPSMCDTTCGPFRRVSETNPGPTLRASRGRTRLVQQ